MVDGACLADGWSAWRFALQARGPGTRRLRQLTLCNPMCFAVYTILHMLAFSNFHFGGAGDGNHRTISPFSPREVWLPCLSDDEPLLHAAPTINVGPRSLQQTEAHTEEKHSFDHGSRPRLPRRGRHRQLHRLPNTTYGTGGHQIRAAAS